MSDIPVYAQLGALSVLLALSAFFSIAETSMMALNRYRLKALAAQGSRGAQLATGLLARPDRLLGVILIGNNLINAGISAMVTAMAISYFGNNQAVIALANGLVAFLIIVFAEITPKVIGATFPERIALPISFILKPLLAVAYPFVWFVNLFVRLLLGIFRLRTDAAAESQRLNPEELRLLVLESGHFIPQKHRSILLNLFDLERIRVDDVMTPRAQIEAIDLASEPAAMARQVATSHHTRLLVYEGDVNNIKGVPHVRRAAAALHDGNFNRDRVIELLAEPTLVQNRIAQSASWTAFDAMTPNKMPLGWNSHSEYRSPRTDFTKVWGQAVLDSTFQHRGHELASRNAPSIIQWVIADPGRFRAGLGQQWAEPYFIPAATPVFQQLQFFQERKQRLALVVDEYGDLQGLVSLEDIVEEMIGEFTTAGSFAGSLDFKWGPDDTVVMEGGASLREINRRLGLRFPVDGPKTLNGLILEHLQDIPESGLSLRVAGCAMEILQTQDRLIRTVRLRRFANDDQTDAAP